MSETWLNEDLLQEFFAEVEEHLGNIRRQLLALEQVEDLTPCIQEALRAYHTLKGITGMVGLEQAMHLSHQMESLLKAVQREAVPLTPEVVDLLLEGADALEALVARLRDPNAPQPALEALLERAQRLLTGGEAEEAEETEPVVEKPPSRGQRPLPDLPAPWPAHLDDAIRARIAERLAQGQGLAEVTFVPSAERQAQGYTLEQVRETLAAWGEVLNIVPLTQEGDLRFLFLLTCPPEATPPEDLPVRWRWLYRPPAAKAASPAPPAASLRPPSPPAATLRVPLPRLDELMRLTGELIITVGHLRDVLAPWRQRTPALDDALTEPLRHLQRHLRDLREVVFTTRLVPLEEVFQRLPLAVREVARAMGKAVRLEIHGAEVEVDKALAEQLAAPLLHLVRNAVAHGIEPPEVRQRLGKPREGVVRVAAYPEGDAIRIEVGDDGRGLDLDAIAAKAHRLGLLPELRSITPEEALALITRPGFSTREQADRSAGRGVGMDVVAGMVQRFRGTLTLRTAPGQGTTFVLRLPLTLTIADVLLVEIAGGRYAVPRSDVEEVLEVVEARVRRTPAGWMYLHRGQSLPVLPLTALFEGVAPTATTPQGYGLLYRAARGPVLFAVERIVGLREVLVHPLTDPLVAVRGVSGATELGDGRALLILDLGGWLPTLSPALSGGPHG